MSPPRFSWPKLLLGAALTLVGSLSVHVVMLQVLRVPFPDEQVSPWAALLNAAASFWALLTVYRLAQPKLSRYGFWRRALLMGALYAMLAETVRGALMNAVVTTAWVFSLLGLLPKCCYFAAAGLLVVGLAPRLAKGWHVLLAAGFITAVLQFGLTPLVAWLTHFITAPLAYLDHDEVFHVPYGWHVLVPAYLTYAEPVAACFFLAALTWDQLAPSPAGRLLRYVGLILLLKRVLIRAFLYSFYAQVGWPVAFLRESQFLLEALVLAALAGLTWSLARTKLVRVPA